MQPRLVQIRAHALKPGRVATFHRLFVERSLPLLVDAGIEVVAYGPSVHGPDAWFLIRAFDDLAQVDAQEEAFHASDAWRSGPREAIVDAIDRYLDTLVRPSPRSIDDVRIRNTVTDRCRPDRA